MAGWWVGAEKLLPALNDLRGALPLYSYFDRIQLNDCNLYFIRRFNALFCTVRDNRSCVSGSTGAQWYRDSTGVAQRVAKV